MPTSAAIPFTRVRLRSVQDTSKELIHSYGRTVRKLRSYYVFPSFTIPNVWRGASEIIYRFDFDAGLISLLNKFPLTPPDNVTFCPVLSWREGETFKRYKLWENVGEILWLPLYNKEKIPTDQFYIEIWNTDTRVQYVLGTEDGNVLGTENGMVLGWSGTESDVITLDLDIKLYTSKLTVPEDYCDDEDINLGSPSTCVDPIYDLSGFIPAFGDYYLLIAPCARQLIHGLIREPNYNLLQSTDDTWHYVWTETVDGNTTTHVDQANASPPPDAIGYFAIIRGTKIYKVALRVMPDEGPTNHALSIREELTDDVNKLNVVLLENLTDGQNYGLYISTDLVLRIHPTPIAL